VAVLAAAGCGERVLPSLQSGLGPLSVLPGTPSVDLRADVDRDGDVDVTGTSDDEGEGAWSAARGAIFLPNLDDDSARCRSTDARGQPLADALLPDCNDATDEVVNGDDDWKDLARLELLRWPEAPAGTVVRLALEPADAPVRLFKKTGDRVEVLDPALPLPTADLVNGASLFLEGTDLVRDEATWDGFVDVSVRVVVAESKSWKGGTYSDTVRLRCAPVLTFHHLLPVETAFATSVPREPDSTAFLRDVRAGLTLANPAITFVTPSLEDQWTQDFFETGFTSMPGPAGAQHVMRVFFRSANVEDPRDRSFPMRAAGRIVFTRFRGKDVAGVQQVDLTSSEESQTLNSFGNFETVPPHVTPARRWPLGRVIRGSVRGYEPDPSFVRMTEAQKYQEPSINVDTSWLLVGHVDETMSFLKASTPRGWIVLVNDARLARQMLQDVEARGLGATRLFIGKRWIDDQNNEVDAETTVSAVLANPDVMQASAEAAVKVDAQLAILKRETGVTDAEIVKVPFLHQPVFGGSLAYQPGTVNLFVIDERTVAVPDPHGPVVDGRDLFKTQLEQALSPYQVRVQWVENWNLYHRAAGEVHCGTNAMRAIPSVKWWEVTP
jgi:protein-arginine deiminase